MEQMQDMAPDELVDAPEDDAAPAGDAWPRRRLLVLVTSVLALGAAGWFGWQHFASSVEVPGDAAPASAPARQAKSAEPPAVDGNSAQYVALDPPLVVNFAAGGQLRYLQVSVDLMVGSKKDVDVLHRHEPVLRHALITLFSERDYEALLTRAGTETLRQEALRALRGELESLAGRPVVAELYFSSFVMQ